MNFYASQMLQVYRMVDSEMTKQAILNKKSEFLKVRDHSFIYH